MNPFSSHQFPFSVSKENRLAFANPNVPPAAPEGGEVTKDAKAEVVNPKKGVESTRKAIEGLDRAQDKPKKVIQMKPVLVEGRVDREPQPARDVSNPDLEAAGKTLAESQGDREKAALQATVEGFLKSHPEMKGTMAQLVNDARATQNEMFLANVLNKISGGANANEMINAFRSRVRNDKKRSQGANPNA